MDISSYLREKKTLIDSFLSGYFRDKPQPAVLFEAMDYSLSAGGKRIRPILCIASYEACGGRSPDIVPCAAALEFVHTYSLVHDDLPAMDNDDLRRGKPTNHKVFGEAVAILAGDALLTEAFGILGAPSELASEARLRAVKELADAAGMRGMVAGQVQDMLSENSEPDGATLEFIHRHKTAALLAASVRIGAVISGAGEDVLASVSSYGTNIGLAFQIVDDILDVVGDTAVIGKPRGSDEKRNKLTYPRLYGIDSSRAIAVRFIDDALAAVSVLGHEADPLRGIASYLLHRTN